MKAIRLGFHIFIFIILTVFTQVGGLIFLLSVYINKLINKAISNSKLRLIIKTCCFPLLYLIFTFLFIPYLAKPFGRVALPLTPDNYVKPLNILTCLLNRHYVRPEMKATINNVAIQMNRIYPGTKINYLDANFPFINKFPLLPHLSHNDGKKLDLAFYYTEKENDVKSNEAPSWLGYGIYEDPTSGEKNMPEFCSQKGYWQYGFLEFITPQQSKANFIFDKERTKQVIQLIASQESIRKIFLEPHIKTRLNLKSNKIRFHGCQAVRHDDHLHIQLK